MNIVFHRYNSICEPGYIRAFASLGIDVIEDDCEIEQKSIPSETRVGLIAELILKNRPMFVFSINFFPYISEICERLGVLYVCVSVDCPVAELYSVSIRNSVNRVFLFDRAQFSDIVDENPGHIFYLPLGAYNTERKNIEYKYDVSFIGSLYNEKSPYQKLSDRLTSRARGLCDGLLSSQEILGGLGLLDAVLGRIGNSAFRADAPSRNPLLPGGADAVITSEIKSAVSPFMPEILHDSDGYITDMEALWAVDSMFGYELTVRDRLLLIASLGEYLRDRALVHLFTRSDTKALISLSDSVILHDGVNTLGEMPEVFMSSRININTTTRPIRSGLPQRIWDILGVGGFLLTDYRSDIPDDLIIGTHLDAFESADEACEKAAFYLEHEDLRMEIAENGYKEVCEKHTILNRVTSMISMIMNDRSQTAQ